MRHGILTDIVANYAMYKECCNCELVKKWEVNQEDCLAYQQFWLKLSQQMIEYDPTSQLNKHDENMRRSTYQLKWQQQPDQIVELTLGEDMIV